MMGRQFLLTLVILFGIFKIYSQLQQNTSFRPNDQESSVPVKRVARQITPPRAHIASSQLYVHRNLKKLQLDQIRGRADYLLYGSKLEGSLQEKLASKRQMFERKLELEKRAKAYEELQKRRSPGITTRRPVGTVPKQK